MGRRSHSCTAIDRESQEGHLTDSGWKRDDRVCGSCKVDTDYHSASCRVDTDHLIRCSTRSRKDIRITEAIDTADAKHRRIVGNGNTHAVQGTIGFDKDRNQDLIARLTASRYDPNRRSVYSIAAARRYALAAFRRPGRDTRAETSRSCCRALRSFQRSKVEPAIEDVGVVTSIYTAAVVAIKSLEFTADTF